MASLSQFLHSSAPFGDGGRQEGQFLGTGSLLIWEAICRVSYVLESEGRVCGLPKLLSDFLAPSYPEPLVPFAPLQNCIHSMAEKSRESWKQAESWQTIFSAVLSLAFYYL